jgi:hypothetical protein
MREPSLKANFIVDFLPLCCFVFQRGLVFEWLLSWKWFICTTFGNVSRPSSLINTTAPMASSPSARCEGSLCLALPFTKLVHASEDFLWPPILLVNCLSAHALAFVVYMPFLLLTCFAKASPDHVASCAQRSVLLHLLPFIAVSNRTHYSP